MKIQCPNCKQHYEIDNSFLGTTVSCEICKHVFIVKRSFFYSKVSKVGVICIFEGVVILLLGILFLIITAKKDNNASIQQEKNEQMQRELLQTNSELKRLQSLLDKNNSDLLSESSKHLAEREKLEDKIIRLESEIEQLKEHNNIMSINQNSNKNKIKSTNTKNDDILVSRYLKKQFDFMEDITWYTSKRSCEFEIADVSYLSFSIHLGKTKDNYLLLRLRIAYIDASSAVLELKKEAELQGIYIEELERTTEKGKWLWYNSVLIKGSNGKSVKIDIDSKDKKTDIEEYHGSLILKEMSDSYITGNADALSEIAQSKTLYVKFYGKNDFAFEMTDEQTLAFKEIMQQYDSMK